jgi:hypothetical protein
MWTLIHIYTLTIPKKKKKQPKHMMVHSVISALRRQRWEHLHKSVAWLVYMASSRTASVTALVGRYIWEGRTKKKKIPTLFRTSGNLYSEGYQGHMSKVHVSSNYIWPQGQLVGGNIFWTTQVVATGIPQQTHFYLLYLGGAQKHIPRTNPCSEGTEGARFCFLEAFSQALRNLTQLHPWTMSQHIIRPCRKRQ